MTIAACYDLRLECDGRDCKAGEYGLRKVSEYTHEFGATARARARKSGWVLYWRSGLCLCPSCVRRGAIATEFESTPPESQVP